MRPLYNEKSKDFIPFKVRFILLGPKYLCRHFLAADPDECEKNLPKEFLDEFFNRFQGDELLELLGPIMNGLSEAMRDINLTRTWQTPFRALVMLLSYKSVVDCVRCCDVDSSS